MLCFLKSISVHIKFDVLVLNFPMLRLLLSKAQGCKDFIKLSTLYHIGIYWIALAKYYEMSTHVPGVQSFFFFLASFCIGQISHQQHKV